MFAPLRISPAEDRRPGYRSLPSLPYTIFRLPTQNTEEAVFFMNVITDLKKQVAALGMTDLFAGRRVLVE